MDKPKQLASQVLAWDEATECWNTAVLTEDGWRWVLTVDSEWAAQFDAWEECPNYPD